jgi:hypothetical protein
LFAVQRYKKTFLQSVFMSYLVLFNIKFHIIRMPDIPTIGQDCGIRGLTAGTEPVEVTG